MDFEDQGTFEVSDVTDYREWEGSHRPVDSTRETVAKINRDGDMVKNIVMGLAVVLCLFFVAAALLGAIAIAVLSSPKPTSMSPPQREETTAERKLRLQQEIEELKSEIEEYKLEHNIGRFHDSIPHAHGFEEVRGVRRYLDGRVDPFCRRQSW